MIDHKCMDRQPECLCNRCKNDTPGTECRLWDAYGCFGHCPVFECEMFEPEEVQIDAASKD